MQYTCDMLTFLTLYMLRQHMSAMSSLANSRL